MPRTLLAMGCLPLPYVPCTVSAAAGFDASHRAMPGRDRGAGEGGWAHSGRDGHRRGRRGGGRRRRVDRRRCRGPRGSSGCQRYAFTRWVRVMGARLVDTWHTIRRCAGRSAVIDESWEAPDWCVPIKANVLSFEWEVSHWRLHLSSRRHYRSCSHVRMDSGVPRIAPRQVRPVRRDHD